MSSTHALEHSIREDFLFEDHKLTLQECYRKYSTNAEWGLSEEQVLQRRLVHGWNALKAPKTPSKLRLWAAELVSGFSPVLWLAAVFCFGCWLWPVKGTGRGEGEIYNLLVALLLVGVILIQGTFTFCSQVNSSNLTQSFQNILPTQSMVLREGAWMHVPSAALVPGDIVQLGAGEKVHADLRCISTNQGKFEKSSLTGESQGVSATVECTHGNLLESRNLLFSGCSLLEGTVEGVVIRIGDRTVLGNIAKLASDPSIGQEDATSLQKEINYFVSLVACMACVTSIGILGWWLLWLRREHAEFLGLGQVVIVCMISSVAFIPDGLPLAVTLTLSLAARRMCRVNILAKKLAAVETLGATTVIATDKTGTITRNCMSLEGIWCSGLGKLQGLDTSAVGCFLARLSVLCNRCKVHGDQLIGGNATESALYTAAVGVLSAKEIASIKKQWTLLEEQSFSSRTKFHSVLMKSNSGSRLFIIKGAPEVILEQCGRVMPNISDIRKIDDDSDCIIMNAELKAEIAAMASYQASHGHRVLAIAFQPGDSAEAGRLIFAGLLFLIDPPREGVKEAIQACKEAGVRVMMVTGDHPGTALAIASQVGIVESQHQQGDKNCKTWNPISMAINNPNQSPIENESSLLERFFPRSTLNNCTTFPGVKDESLLIEGQHLDTLTHASWDWILSHGRVIFARTTPMHKLSIVQHLQRRGEIVAVTGDGLNDAPALKRADIGIAMGKAGSEVSKEAANMILLDDDFSSIVKGIREGRLLFDNLRKVIAYLLSAGSFSEILPVLAFVFFGVPLPLSPFQMILICLGTDFFGALAICHEGPESNIMRRPPRNPQKDGLVSYSLLAYSMVQVGLVEFLVACFVYFTTLSHCKIVLYDILFAYERWEQEGIFAGQPLDSRLSAQKQAQTGFFLALVVIQMWNLVGVRTRVQFSIRRWRLWLFVAIGGQVLLAAFFCLIGGVRKWLMIGAPIWFQVVFPLGVGVMAWALEEWRKIVVRQYPVSLVRKYAW